MKWLCFSFKLPWLSLTAALAAHAAVDAAEGRLRASDRGCVDPRHAGADCATDMLGAAKIAHETACRRPVLGIVRPFDDATC
jgi:hypothetical protein